MIKNSLEIEWMGSVDSMSVGHGVIATQHDKIDFIVKNPHEKVNDYPVFFFPGFTDGIGGADRLTNAYAESGRLAISLSYPRTENPDFDDDPEGHKVNSGILVLDAVRSIFPELLEADLKGHSEGGSNASRACLEYPEEFRTLIVMASGGLIKDDNITKITLRALSNPQLFIRSTGQLMSHPKYSLNLFSNASSYVRQNALKARKEAVRTASAYIAPRFPVISEKKGIPTGALQFLGDVLFPLKLVKKSTDNGSIFDLFVEYPYDDATHITPQNHPRTVAQTTLRMMEELLEIRDLRLSS